MTRMTTLSPSLRVLIPTTAPRRDLPLDFPILAGQTRSIPSLKKLAFPGNLLDFQSSGKICGFGGRTGFGGFNAWSQEGSLQEVEDVSPVSVELEPICSESQFDRVVAEAQQLEASIIVVWMANWCRKCIYLKPKLERLAADYHPRLRFYCIDVNNVPHKLVARAGVTKMPTIQLWKDRKKQAEVIGGHKAYLVVNEVRQMIESESTPDL